MSKKANLDNLEPEERLKLELKRAYEESFEEADETEEVIETEDADDDEEEDADIEIDDDEPEEEPEEPRRRRNR